MLRAGCWQLHACCAGKACCVVHALRRLPTPRPRAATESHISHWGVPAYTLCALTSAAAAAFRHTNPIAPSPPEQRCELGIHAAWPGSRCNSKQWIKSGWCCPVKHTPQCSRKRHRQRHRPPPVTPPRYRRAAAPPWPPSPSRTTASTSSAPFTTPAAIVRLTLRAPAQAGGAALAAPPAAAPLAALRSPSAGCAARPAASRPGPAGIMGSTTTLSSMRTPPTAPVKLDTTSQHRCWRCTREAGGKQWVA